MVNLKSNMRKRIKSLGICLTILSSIGLVFTPAIKEVNHVFAEDNIVEISALSQITDNSGHYKLVKNIETVNNFTPIGTKDAPFTGTFDGNGCTISNIQINSGVDCQGLFGYTSGATIKNLKVTSGIEFKVSNAPSRGQYYLGTIVGYADNGTIVSNCEIEIDQQISVSSGYKVAMGSIAGGLSGTSEIDNCVSYNDLMLSSNLQNIYGINLGGVVGELTDSAALTNVANFGDIEYKASDDLQNECNIGGIAGYISGYNASLTNVVSAGKVIVEDNEKNAIDSINEGAVAGKVSPIIPQSGNFQSVAYKQELPAYGSNLGYSEKDSITKDYVARLPESSFYLDNFYFGESFNYSFVEGVKQEFKWYAMTTGWDKGIWTLNIEKDIGNEDVNKLKLQQFQKFEVKLANPIDYGGLLKVTDGKSNTSNGGFGETVELCVSLKDEENKGFYKLTTIYRNDAECDVEKLLSSDGVPTKDVSYFENIDKNGYTIKIKLSSQTAGSYSIGMKAVTFEGSLLVDENIAGGSVKFSGGTAETRTFTKDSLATSAEAKAGSLYIFKHWDLYYKTTEANAKDQGVIKPGYIQLGNVYWENQGAVYTSYNSQNDYKYASSSLPVKFGAKQSSFVLSSGEANYSYLDRDFLLKAEFELDPYRISFVNKDTNTRDFVTKVVVNGIDIAETYNFAVVGKAELIKVEIYVAEGYKLDTELLQKAIQNENKQPSITIREEDLGSEKLYTMTFNTNKLDISKMDPNERNKFVFNLVLNEESKGNGNVSLPWIIGGSIGGVVLIGLIIFLIIYFKGGPGGGSSKKVKSKPNDDYKKYYY